MEKILFEELTLISSRQNLRFKEWNRLSTAQGVKKQGQLVVEGLRACLTALEHGMDIAAILISDDKIGAHIYEKIINLLNGDQFGYNTIFRLSQDLFNAVADAKNPQGIMFVINKPELLNLADWLKKKDRQLKTSQTLNTAKIEQKLLKIVLLDKLTDPGNVGTMIRTADAFDFSGIILSEGTADPYNPKVIRSTMGSLFALDLLKIESYDELAALAKQYSLPILISDLDGQALSDFKLEQNSAGFILGVGNEAHGISDELSKIANEVLTIPMPGKAESLNAAIAFGIIAYQLTINT